MKYFIRFLITYFTFIFVNAFPQTELSQKQQQLLQKQNILIAIENKISTVQTENSKAVENLTKIEKYQKIKQFDFEKKKNLYERASKNIDLVTREQMSRLFTEYQQANEEINKANSELEEAKLKLQESNKILDQFKTDKSKIEQEIQNIKADIFDIQLREPVWAIGEAVCTLSEIETPDHCKERALNDARKDATEKAGKMILESETIVKNYQLYLDEIRTHIQAQVLDQDNSPQYGVKRVLDGDNIKYNARIRLKVQSINTYNPYRNEQPKQTEKRTTIITDHQTPSTKNIEPEIPLWDLLTPKPSTKNIEPKIITQAKTIAQDDFESGTFDGGAGWLDSWQYSGYQTVRPNSRAKQGSYDAVIWGTKQGSYIMRVTSFSSARRPHLQFWGRAESFFVNALSPSEEDYAIIQVSIDTKNWRTVATWTMNDDRKPYRFVDVDLSSYAGVSRVFLRIAVFFKSTQMLGSYPMFFVDDIKIIDLDSN